MPRHPLALARTAQDLPSGRNDGGWYILPLFRKKEEGFTLVEIIMVLILLGFIGAMAGLGFIQITKGMIFSRANAETAGKAQLAIMRITREFTVLKDVSSGTGSSISFTSIHDGGVDKTYTLSLAGTDLTMNDGTDNDILVDNVSNFTLTYYDTFNGNPSSTWGATKKIIGVSLTLTGADGVAATFSTRIAPRNL